MLKMFMKKIDTEKIILFLIYCYKKERNVFTLISILWKSKFHLFQMFLFSLFSYKPWWQWHRTTKLNVWWGSTTTNPLPLNDINQRLNQILNLSQKIFYHFYFIFNYLSLFFPTNRYQIININIYTKRASG